MQPSTTLCPPHLSPLYEPRWKENRDSPPLPRPINSFITALLLRKSPPRIITSPVISPLFSYARDNGYVANHSCTSIDLAHRFFVPFHRLFSPLPFFRSSKLSIRLDSTRFAPRCSREIQIFPETTFHLDRYLVEIWYTLPFFRLI